ncbi:MAG: site-2 protease family protein [Candidatus Omnitrophota bacterium]
MILSMLFQFVVLALAITTHEFAHGWVAYKLGDPTAKYAGRLTFNPLAHIELFGTIILPITMVMLKLPPIGWAKPVPINFQSLRNPKRDMLWVGIAGPGANFLIALLLSLLLRIPQIREIAFFMQLLTLGIFMNLILAIFNLIPIPPLDGSRIIASLLPWRYMFIYNRIEPYGFFIIIGLLWLGVLRTLILPLVIKLAMLLDVVNLTGVL